MLLFNAILDTSSPMVLTCASKCCLSIFPPPSGPCGNRRRFAGLSLGLGFVLVGARLALLFPAFDFMVLLSSHASPPAHCIPYLHLDLPDPLCSITAARAHAPHTLPTHTWVEVLAPILVVGMPPAPTSAFFPSASATFCLHAFLPPRAA